MHSTINYADKTDDDAVADIRSWCSDKQWLALCELRDQVLAEKISFKTIAIALSFVGVQGFPVHAFGRTFCPTQWQDWYDKLPE